MATALRLSREDDGWIHKWHVRGMMIRSAVCTKAGTTRKVPGFFLCFLKQEDKYIYMPRVNNQWRDKTDTRGKDGAGGSFPGERARKRSRALWRDSCVAGNGQGALPGGFDAFVESQARSLLPSMVAAHHM